ncbi:hypothetical protein Hanom_Chr10g00897511 [Helianthus anomalus]
MSDSEMDEGPSRAIPGYEADVEGSFIFNAKSTEPIPPKKKGWFNKEKREKRKKKKNTVATITLSEGTTQIPLTKRPWEELNRRLANCDMFQPIVEETNPNLLVPKDTCTSPVTTGTKPVIFVLI